MLLHFKGAETLDHLFMFQKAVKTKDPSPPPPSLLRGYVYNKNFLPFSGVEGFG